MRKVTIFFLLVVVLQIQLRGQVNAVVKNSITKIHIFGNGKAEITKDYEIQINSEKGIRHSVFVDYYDKFKKIKTLEVLVLDQSGSRVKKLNKSKAFDVKFNKSFEIDDSRILYLNPNYRHFPFTVKISVTSVIDGFISLPTWIPRFDYNLEVESASFEIEYPIDYKLNILEENIEISSEKLLSNTKTITWEVDNLIAISSDVNRTMFNKLQPKVLIAPTNFELEGIQGSFASWQNFGDWFLKLNEGRDELSLDTKSFLDSVKVLGNAHLIEEIYHYMQDRTRYVSIQLGIGGFQTIPASVVEATGYGDCKALTNYMKAMLNYVDISSNYILVKAGSDVSDVIAEFPSNQFNHVFLGIPGAVDTVLLECTSQLSPINYIGKFTDDRNVLWVQENNSEIIRTKKYSEYDNIKTTKGTININKSGNAEISVDISNKGIFYDELIRYKHVTLEDAKQYHYKKFTYQDYSINDLAFSEIHRDSVNFNLHLNLTVNHLAKRSSDKLLVPFNLWLPIESYLDIKNVSSSIQIKRGFKIVDNFEISFPHNYWEKQLPEKIHIDSKFGYYDISVKRVDEKFIINREVVFKKGFYENVDFKEFDTFLKKLKRIDNKKIVLNSRT